MSNSARKSEMCEKVRSEKSKHMSDVGKVISEKDQGFKSYTLSAEIENLGGRRWGETGRRRVMNQARQI